MALFVGSTHPNKHASWRPEPLCFIHFYRFYSFF